MLMSKTGDIIVLAAIACLQGSYMISDGIHDLTTGSYIGGKVGPWAILVRAAGFDEHSMGPVFICVRVLWLLGCITLFVFPRRGMHVLIVAAIVTLLYPLFGTLLAIVALVIIWKQRYSMTTASSGSRRQDNRA